MPKNEVETVFLTELQLAVVESYPDNDVRHFSTLDEVMSYGDTLFQFLVLEAKDAGDPDEYLGMLNTALTQVQTVQHKIGAARWLTHIDSMPVDEALWWFVENVPEDAPWRNDLFFRLRERVRTGK